MSDIDDLLDRMYDEHQPEEADAPALTSRCKRCGEDDLIWSRMSKSQAYVLTNRMGRRHTCKAAPAAFPLVSA